jgi:hypothetical protein
MRKNKKSCQKKRQLKTGLKEKHEKLSEEERKAVRRRGSLRQV